MGEERIELSQRERDRLCCTRWRHFYLAEKRTFLLCADSASEKHSRSALA